MQLYGVIDLHSNNSVVGLIDEQNQVVYQKRLLNRKTLEGPQDRVRLTRRLTLDDTVMRSRIYSAGTCPWTLGPLPDPTTDNRNHSRTVVSHSVGGNRRHAYFSINLDIVWQTVREDLPRLIALLEPLVPPEPDIPSQG